MPGRARRIRRGIYLGRAILAFIKMGDLDRAKRVIREAEREPRTTYIALIDTIKKGLPKNFRNGLDI